MATPMRTPLIFVHGWAGSAGSWNPVIELLNGAAWDPMTVPLPGSPGAASDGGEATIPAAVDLVVDLLGSLAAPAVLVGHSMGAQVTMLAHTRASDRVLGEVVIDPAYGGDASARPEMEEWAARIEEDGHLAVVEFFASALAKTDPAVATAVNLDVLATPAPVIASYLRSEYLDAGAVGLEPATSTVAARRRKPVLSVHSTPASAWRENSLPTPAGSLSELWLGRSHYAHLEEPARFADLLERWATSLVSQCQTPGPVHA